MTRVTCKDDRQSHQFTSTRHCTASTSNPNRMGPKDKHIQPCHNFREDMKESLKLSQGQTDSKSNKLNYTCQWFTCGFYFSFPEYCAHNLPAHSIFLPMLLLPPALLNILARADGHWEQGNQASLCGSKQHTQLFLCSTDPIPFPITCSDPTA